MLQCCKVHMSLGNVSWALEDGSYRRVRPWAGLPGGAVWTRSPPNLQMDSEQLLVW